MITGFGAFDEGFYSFDPHQGRSERPLRQANLDDLRVAAHHMLYMFTYLIRYERASKMYERAVYLAQRELVRNRTPEQIKFMLQTVYTAASMYNLLDSAALKLSEELLEQALQDIALFADEPPVE
jgi:hypothetical protein